MRARDSILSVEADGLRYERYKTWRNTSSYNLHTGRMDKSNVPIRIGKSCMGRMRTLRNANDDFVGALHIWSIVCPPGLSVAQKIKIGRQTQVNEQV